MEQVRGRAGRKEATGKVLVQTSQPKHPLLQIVQQHDYNSMFNEEIKKRKEFSYPPFTRIIQITFKHKFREVVERAAAAYANALKQRYGQYLVGPAEPVIGRIRNQYLMELLLKLPRDGKTINQCKKDLLEHTAVLHQEPSYRSVTVVADVDPV